MGLGMPAVGGVELKLSFQNQHRSVHNLDDCAVLMTCNVDSDELERDMAERAMLSGSL